MIHLFLTHINEFEYTRLDQEKERQVLFPEEINSLFDVIPISASFIPSVESLELFMSKLIYLSKCIKAGFQSEAWGDTAPWEYILENTNKKSQVLALIF